MKYTIAKRKIKDNVFTGKYTLSEEGTHKLTKVFYKSPEGKNISLLNGEFYDIINFDDEFLYNESLLEKIEIPLVNRKGIFLKNDYLKNKDFFNSIISLNRDDRTSFIKIIELDSSALGYNIQLDIVKLDKNVKNNTQLFEKLLILATKKSKKNIFDNLKNLYSLLFYSLFPNIKEIEHNKLYNPNKIDYMLSLKNGTRKGFFFSNIIDNLIYFSYVDFYLNYNKNNLDKQLYIKLFSKIFNNIEKDINNKKEYQEIVELLRRNTERSTSNNNFYLILENIFILSLM